MAAMSAHRGANETIVMGAWSGHYLLAERTDVTTRYRHETTTIKFPNGPAFVTLRREDAFRACCMFDHSTRQLKPCFVTSDAPASVPRHYPCAHDGQWHLPRTLGDLLFNGVSWTDQAQVDWACQYARMGQNEYSSLHPHAIPSCELADVGITVRPTVPNVNATVIDAVSALEYCRIKVTVDTLCGLHLADVRVPLNVLIVTTTTSVPHGMCDHRGLLVHFEHTEMVWGHVYHGRDEQLQGPTFYLPVPVQWDNPPYVLDPKGDAVSQFAPDNVDHGYPSVDYCARTASFPSSFTAVPAMWYEFKTSEGRILVDPTPCWFQPK